MSRPEILSKLPLHTDFAPLSWASFDAFCFALVPRVGSRALGLVFQDRSPRPNPIMLVRDPMERFLSAYFFLSEPSVIHPGTEREKLMYEGHIAQKYEEFVDAVLSGERDPHWEPQMSYYDQLADPQMFAFEDIDALWQALEDQYVGEDPFPRLRKVNTARRFEVDEDYRLAELKGLYENDYVLRELTTEIALPARVR